MLLSGLLILVALTTSTPGSAVVVRSGGEDDGMDLLRRAARIGQETAYEGVQSVSVRSSGDADAGTVTERAEVVHRPGEGTGYASLPAEGGLGEQSLVVGQSPSLLKLNDRLLRALERNYRVTRSGSDTVNGRGATVVEARRGDGTAAGRFWVDDRTSLLMRREAYVTTGEVAHSVRFVTLAVGTETAPLPEASGRSGHWGESLPAPERRRLADGGWELPEHLSWGLRFVGARTKGTGEERVVHLSYSDGLSIVSVFVQRGRLEPESVGTARGMRPVVEGGGTAYVGDSGKYRRIWESGGFVYTVLTDAPPEIVGTAVEALPAPDGSGFWAQVRRGFERLGAGIADVAGR
ncbi:sigma-E factor regulatory protein RseB domain-containing protein [Allosalinactinospora lopnorensis]|uniref:sigma-E factor regulatory protein RseB domain-containing protein n=1 Tax=Allosalinactinospora lopnorensis TaxID=1352348 RepID=UPI000697D42C|nr:sigma-E factor regulatory protein RseB domain-containing protein [Allosalinactinospora lopnorensis]